jgi:hypothetical protein
LLYIRYGGLDGARETLTCSPIYSRWIPSPSPNARVRTGSLHVRSTAAPARRGCEQSISGPASPPASSTRSPPRLMIYDVMNTTSMPFPHGALVMQCAAASSSPPNWAWGQLRRESFDVPRLPQARSGQGMPSQARHHFKHDATASSPYEGLRAPGVAPTPDPRGPLSASATAFPAGPPRDPRPCPPRCRFRRTSIRTAASPLRGLLLRLHLGGRYPSNRRQAAGAAGSVDSLICRCFSTRSPQSLLPPHRDGTAAIEPLRAALDAPSPRAHDAPPGDQALRDGSTPPHSRDVRPFITARTRAHDLALWLYRRSASRTADFRWRPRHRRSRKRLW